jgi:hypothetical protein
VGFSWLGATISKTSQISFNIYANPETTLPVLMPEKLGWRPYVFDVHRFEIQHKNNDLEIQ